MRALVLLICLLSAITIKAQTGIGTTTPHASAKLHVESSNKGFLPPRVTLTSATDASTIASPAEGLLVYNLGSVGLQAGYYYWNGANWATIATATSAGNGVTASDMVKIYDGVANAATINTDGATFTVTTSGRYSFDFSTSATCNSCNLELNFQVRDGSNNSVIASDKQNSYSNNVHAEYNGKIEANLVSGKNYNVRVFVTSTSNGTGYVASNDYCRVYMKQVAGNLPVTGQTVDYVSVSTISQSTVGNGVDLIFTSNNGGNIPYNTSTGVFTLSANKTYLFQAQIRINTPSAANNPGLLEFGFVDATSNALLINGTQTITTAATTYAGFGINPVVNFIYTPTTNQTVKLRTTSSPGGTVSVISGTANITQIGSSAIINPWTLSGTNTYNTTGNVGIGNNTPSAALDVTGTGKFSTSIINNGTRTYFGKDGANMHWFATTDNIAESNNLAYGFESNGSSIQSHKWFTAGTEKMKLINTGKLGIGTSTPATIVHIENGNPWGGSDNPSSTSSPSLYILNNNNTSTSANSSALIRTAGLTSGKPYLSLDVMSQFGYSIGVNNPTDQLILNTTWNFATGTAGNNAITINRSGKSRVVIPEQGGSVATDWPAWGGGLATYDICAASINASNYITRSDFRLKNTISTISDDDIAKFLQLRPVNFYWNQDKPRDPKLQYGLIAQEVEKLFPEIVNTAIDSMQTKSVNYQALHALSLKVIQAQQNEINALKKKQDEIEMRLLKLEAKLN